MNLVMNSFTSSIKYAVRSQRRYATEYATTKHGTVYVHVSNTIGIRYILLLKVIV